MSGSVETSTLRETEIAAAREEDLAVLSNVERRAATMFPPGTLPDGVEGDVLPVAVTREAVAEGRLFVARRVKSAQVVGFVLVAEADGHGHLDEIDVDPDWGRRGIGRRLVERACLWAESKGYFQISLSTFRDIPWNAPFYARLNFVETAPSDLGRDVAKRRAQEEREGFDMSRRCLMVRLIEGD